MTARIVVLGGGIVGTVVASRLLAEDGTRRITLVDAGLVGNGASQYSAGVHFPVGCSARVKALAATSADYYERMRTRAPAVPIHPFEPWVAADSAQAAEVEARCTGLRAPNAADGRVPADLAPGLELWRLPGCHVADVQQVAQWHARQLLERAKLIEGLRVTAIDESAAGVRVQLSDGRTLAADALVLAPGPWANTGAFKPFTAALGIRIKKVVALHVDPAPARDAALFFPLEDAFLAPLPHRGHGLFSYTCTQWDVTPEAMRHASLERREFDEAQAVLGRVAPGLLAQPPMGGRVFCDAYGPEREPIVCGVGTHGRIVFVGAANGSGYRLAPGMADEAAGLLRHLAPQQGFLTHANL
ncbi:MAG: FAD-binding oxidoreductase [Ramlibacter sp.]|nr:FAD-binding oxidoreductase [Ramlibacter sp.]